MESKGKKVLCVGLVCLDLINECRGFPDEDSDQRSLSLRWQRGGNAANNCTVLSQSGSDCEFLGVMSSDIELSFITKDFIEHGISIKNCPMKGSDVGKSFLDSFPVSIVIINSSNGSRTILHSKGDTAEISIEDFKKLDLSEYYWIHFEGRNIEAVSSMTMYVKSWRSKNHSEVKETSNLPVPLISVELEKPKYGLINLAINADVVFMGKDFSRHHGWNDMESAINGMVNHVSSGTLVVCAWGEQGSSAMYLFSEISDDESVRQSLASGNLKLYKSLAYPPPVIVDTLGAGDTFVAAFIQAYSGAHSVEKALQFACKLAGAKVGMKGFSEIKTVYTDIMKE